MEALGNNCFKETVEDMPGMEKVHKAENPLILNPDIWDPSGHSLVGTRRILRVPIQGKITLQLFRLGGSIKNSHKDYQIISSSCS